MVAVLIDTMFVISNSSSRHSHRATCGTDKMRPAHK